MSDFFDTIGKRISDTVDDLGKKAGDTIDIQKKKNEIYGLKRDSERDMTEIGRLVYERFKQGEVVDTDFIALCEARNLPQSPQQRSDDESFGFQTKAGKGHVGGSTWNPVFLGAPSLERTRTQTGKAWNIADAGRSSW